jgi:hypothetical protein
MRIGRKDISFMLSTHCRCVLMLRSVFEKFVKKLQKPLRVAS